MMGDYEYCIYCGESTGRAGAGEDSLMCAECGDGPYCGECYEGRDDLGPCCNPKYL